MHHPVVDIENGHVRLNSSTCSPTEIFRSEPAHDAFILHTTTISNLLAEIPDGLCDLAELTDLNLVRNKLVKLPDRCLIKAMTLRAIHYIPLLFAPIPSKVAPPTLKKTVQSVRALTGDTRLPLIFNGSCWASKPPMQRRTTVLVPDTTRSLFCHLGHFPRTFTFSFESIVRGSILFPTSP